MNCDVISQSTYFGETFQYLELHDTNSFVNFKTEFINLQQIKLTIIIKLIFIITASIVTYTRNSFIKSNTGPLKHLLMQKCKLNNYCQDR